MKNSDNSTCCGECIYVSSIRLASWATQLPVGEVAFISRYILPYDATNQKVTWSSSNNAIATVNPDTGLVTAQSVGTVVITATAVDRGIVSGTFAMEVVPYVFVDSVTIVGSKVVVMRPCNKICINASALPTNATRRKVYWESSNECVATVDPLGVVKANKEGETVITATTIDKDGSRKQDYCYVIIRDEDLSSCDFPYVQIPQDGDLGTSIEYEGYHCITSKSSKQYQLREHARNNNRYSIAHTKYYAMIDGRIAIAVRPKIGGILECNVGDYLDVIFKKSSGEFALYKCIVGDRKGADAGNDWGHDNGKTVVEVIYHDYDPPCCYEENKNNPWGSGRVVQIIKSGNYGNFQ